VGFPSPKLESINYEGFTPLAKVTQDLFSKKIYLTTCQILGRLFPMKTKRRTKKVKAPKQVRVENGNFESLVALKKQRPRLSMTVLANTAMEIGIEHIKKSFAIKPVTLEPFSQPIGPIRQG
jgi:hypothetical protein